jgi:hypothetical protein
MSSPHYHTYTPTTHPTTTSSPKLTPHSLRSVSARPRPLCEHLAGIKLDQHGGIRLEVLDGHGQAEVVEEEELQLEVVEFGQGEAADLDINT